VQSYVAVDRNALVGTLATPVHEALGGLPNNIRYEFLPDFHFAQRLCKARFDVVVSNAAFEHFDDVPGVAREVADCPGGDVSYRVSLETSHLARASPP
jgi:hypothetical protein